MRFRVWLVFLLLAALCPPVSADLQFKATTLPTNSAQRAGKRYALALRQAGLPATDYWDVSRTSRLHWMVRDSGRYSFLWITPFHGDLPRIERLFTRMVQAQGMDAKTATVVIHGSTAVLSTGLDHTPQYRPCTWQLNTPLAVSAACAELRRAGLPAPMLVIIYQGLGTAVLQGTTAAPVRIPNRVYFFPKQVSGSVSLRYGVTPHDRWFIPIAAVLALLAPFVAAVVAGRTALRGPDAATALFGLQRLIAFTGALYPALWFLFALRIHLLLYLRRAAGSGVFGSLIFLAVLVGPMLLIPLGLAAWLTPIERRLRDTGGSFRATFERLALPLIAGALPLVLFISALVLAPSQFGKIFLADGPSRTLLLIGAFIVLTNVFLWIGRRRQVRREPISEGPLYERISALADRAGVTVSALLLERSSEGKVANAYAAGSGILIVTEHLVNSLPPAEVDAVIAHELGHLKHAHPNQGNWSMLAILGVTVLLLDYCTKLVRNALPLYPGVTDLLLSVVWVGAMWLISGQQRRREGIADHFAVEFTGDAPACMRSLYHLAQANTHPLQWSAMSERWSTHPATAKRLEAMAAQAGIHPATIPQILAQASETEHYALPVEPEGWAFGPTQRAWQHEVMLRYMLPAFLIPGIALFAVMLLDIKSIPGFFAGILMLLAIGCPFLLPPLAYSRALRVVNRRVLRWVAERHGVPVGTPGLLLCGVSPGNERRIYQGDDDRDVGFLWFDGDRLCFTGDREAFALCRAQVECIERRPQRESFLLTARIYVRWRATPESAPAWINLQPRSTIGLADNRRQIRELAASLQAWQQGSTQPAAPVTPPLPTALPASQELGMPLPPSMTSERKYRWPTLIGVAVICGVIGALVEFLEAKTGHKILQGHDFFFIGVLAFFLLQQVSKKKKR